MLDLSWGSYFVADTKMSSSAQARHAVVPTSLTRAGEGIFFSFLIYVYFKGSWWWVREGGRRGGKRQTGDQ